MSINTSSNLSLNQQNDTMPSPPHISLFSAAGMGHLVPFLRLASMLAKQACTITLITAQPTVSTAEFDHLSNFFTTHPNIKQLKFHLLPYKKSNFINEDPFFIQFESIANSIHILHPLLSSLSPPLSAIIADFAIASSFLDISSNILIPTYILVTTSARFFSLMSSLPNLDYTKITENEFIKIPSSRPIPISNIPPPMLNSDHFFSANIKSNISSLLKAKGILINTFTSFEHESISALMNGELSISLPRILSIGPFESFETRKHDDFLWLNEQEPKSILFISFGSRTSLSRDQIRELGHGLEKSGCKFFWVLKTSKVDKDDKEEVEGILGELFLERTKSKGVVFKGWVNQDRILAHSSIGGFLSHCGWNSVMEAAKVGVPILAWPQHGDQKVNAELVEKAGLGVSCGDWGWGGERLVGKNEISEKIIEVMVNENLRSRVKEVKEKAQQAREINGSSKGLLLNLIEELKCREEK